MFCLSVGEGDSGYEALRVCRRVQVERPSCSTSGGQSGGGASVAGAWVWGRVTAGESVAAERVDFLA
jgi:hypothetical protein